MSEALPGEPLRIAVLGDFEGVHTRRWLEFFVERGHKIHAISYYKPRVDLPGVHVHVLTTSGSPATSTGGHGLFSFIKARMPPSPFRLLNALRYQRAGLRGLLNEVRPDVFHAHYAVEHGFYGAIAGSHPYVVSAWGSDIFVEARKPLGGLIARYGLRRADLVTANDRAMAERVVALGVPAERVAVVRLGIDPIFFEAGGREAEAPTIISDRALEPLYNVDVVIHAFAALRAQLPGVRLVIVHEGSEEDHLRGLVTTLRLGDSVTFRGRLQPEALRDALAESEVYVSVPSSDSFALSTLEAMAAGAFPVVSDLPSQDGWIEHGVNGLRVPAKNATALSEAFVQALTDNEMRNRAAIRNRAMAEAEGNHERNMLAMEAHYYRLAGKLAAREASI